MNDEMFMRCIRCGLADSEVDTTFISWPLHPDSDDCIRMLQREVERLRRQVDEAVSDD